MRGKTWPCPACGEATLIFLTAEGWRITLHSHDPDAEAIWDPDLWASGALGPDCPGSGLLMGGWGWAAGAKAARLRHVDSKEWM